MQKGLQISLVSNACANDYVVSLLFNTPFLHIVGHKEISGEQLSPSKRMKTEGSNAELIVELVNKLGKTSLPKPKKRSMVKAYYHVHVHSCIPAGVQKKLRFLTRRKQVARTCVTEKKELNKDTCPTCGKTFSGGEESLWVGCDS